MRTKWQVNVSIMAKREESVRPGAKFALLCVAVWLYAADTLITATTAPSMILEIGGVKYLNWTISLYEVGAIMAGTSAALTSARLGVKRSLIVAGSFYFAGCAVSATATSIFAVIAGRFIQGLGGGLLLSLCYLAINEWFERRLWNRLFGWVALVWGVGSLLGPLIGAVFAAHHAWRAAFWFFALQALALCLAATFWLLPDSRSKPVAQNWPVLTLTVLTAATLMIAQAGVAKELRASLLSLLLGTALLYVSARIDRTSSARLLPAQLLHIGQPLGAGLFMVFALSMSATGFWAYGPLVLKILFGTSPLVSGYILAAEALAWSGATIAVSRTGANAEIPLIRWGASLVAAGVAGFALAVPAGSFLGMTACALMQGGGFGLCWPALVQRIVSLTDAEDQSRAAAAPSAVQRVGYAVGAAGAGVSANMSGLGEGISVAAAKAAAFWVFAGFIPILFLALFCTWRFTAKPDPQRPMQSIP